MPGKFTNITCVLCRARPSSRDSEHVLPTWFIVHFFPDENKPYSFEIGGRPVVKRDGSPWTHNNFTRVKLPCCTTCNNTLNERFEKPAKSIIKRLFADVSTVILNPNEAHIAGLWLLKTWLLQAHPAALYGSVPSVVIPQQWDLTMVPDDLYSWMVNDQPPPTGLSVWITRMRNSLPDDPAGHRIMLPTVIADGRTIQFQARRHGVQSLDVSLVYHPSWPIEHPLEADGQAVRMWPRSGGSVNIAELPAVNPRTMAWATGPDVYFEPGVYGKTNLPLLRAEMDWTFQAVPGVFGVAAPRLGAAG